MRATFSGIEIGRTGLNVSQLGLDVTGHNIANVETEGYTRQRIVQTAYDPFSTIGRALPVAQALVGGGVRVKILDQIRSAYLDRRYRTENTINAYWLKRTEGLTYLESYFDNVNEETSLNFSLGKFFEAIKVLAKDTVEGAPRKLLQTAGDDLAKQLHSIYEGLIDLQDSQNTAVKVTVEDINRIAAEIVELNKSIYAFEVTGYIANDLRDKRNLLLDDLSTLIDMEYREEADGKGGQRLVVEIGGRTLVDHDRQYKLTVEERDNSIPGEAKVWVPVWEPTMIPGPNSDNKYIPYFTGLDGNKVRLMSLNDSYGVAVDMEDLDAVQAVMDRINQIVARFARITPEWAKIDHLDPLNPDMTPEYAQAQALFDELQTIVGVGNVAVFSTKDENISGWDWCAHTGLRLFGDDGSGGPPTSNWADVMYACSDPPQAQRKIATLRIESGTIELPGSDLVVKGGELKAYLDMRDNYAPGTASTPTPGIPYYIEMLNNLARAIVQEVNEVHREGWTDNPNGSETGINFFDEPSGRIWEASDGSRLIYDSVNDEWHNTSGDVIDPTITYTYIPDDGAGNDCWEDSNGVLYYFNGIEWENSLGDVVDPTITYKYVISDISLVTAKNIRLSDEVLASEFNIACSTDKIVKHGNPDELQRGNNENMNLLYELFLKKDISILIGSDNIDIGSLDSYITAIRFDVANTLSFSKKTAVNSTTLLIAAENQRISVSGVSLDEEMTNMIKYQHAYSGASRVITAMDDMLDRLINNTGRVGL